MNADFIYIKTAAGQAEIGQRSDRLSRPLRNVLLCVDGRRDGEALQALIASIGAPQDALEQLESLGLIANGTAEPVATEPATPVPPPAPVESGAAGVGEPVPLSAAVPLPAATEPAGGVEPLDFASLYQRLNALVSNNLGMIKAVSLQLSIEQCHTIEQLRALIPAVEAALSSKHGKDKAVLLLRDLRAAGTS